MKSQPSGKEDIARSHNSKSDDVRPTCRDAEHGAVVAASVAAHRPKIKICCIASVVEAFDAIAAGADAVGLVSRMPSGPGVSIVQVIQVVDDASVQQALNAAAYVDTLLLDSGNPSLHVKELGGTGRTHDWALSARIVASTPVPVYLTGGLNSANVGDAIAQVPPFGVDLCSSVRGNGRRDGSKLARFVAAVRTFPAGN